MPWHTPPTLSPGYVVTDTDVNNLWRDNPNYLLAGRPDVFTLVATGTDYTISGTSFADVDASNLIMSPAALSGSKYLCEAILTASAAASHYLYFDWILDGTTRAGGTIGVAGAFNG